MKRRLIRHILLMAASILLAACSAVEESAEALSPAQQQPQAVGFNAYVNRGTTRGGAMGTLTTDGSSSTPSLQAVGFGVFAYYTDSHLYNQLSLPNFMYNQHVLYDAGHWTYSPLKYWPNEVGISTGSYDSDRLTFFAYAPYVDVDAATGRYVPGTGEANTGIVALSRPQDSGDPMVRYYASLKPAECVDLCWAVPSASSTSNIDMTKPEVVDATVNFNFRHALAALNVQIDANIDDGIAGPDAQTRVWVRSITFDGFTLRGQLNLNNETSTPRWNNLDCDCDLTAEPVTIYDGRRNQREGVAATLNEGPTGLNPVIVQSAAYDSGELTDGVTKTPVNLFDISEWPYDDADSPTAAEIAARLAAPVFVIPTGDPMRVTIDYDVETQDPKLVSQYLADGKTHGSSIKNVLSATIGSVRKMEAGKQYTINLHLGLVSVKVEASVDLWPDTGTPVPVYFPEN